jgi:hypothetical protein
MFGDTPKDKHRSGMDSPSQEELLRILDAHGQQFMQRFSVLGKRESSGDLNDRPTKISRTLLSDKCNSAHSFDEWGGISNTRDESDSDDSGEGLLCSPPWLMYFDTLALRLRTGR